MDTMVIKKEFEGAVAHLKDEMGQIQTGRATTELLEEIRVPAYGTINPMQNIGSIAVVDSRTLTVTPWDKSLLDPITKAVSDANLGLSVVKEGDLVRVRVPDLTEERRKEYVKIMKERAESERQIVRAIRQKYMKDIETQMKDGLMSEDVGKRLKDEIEKMVKDTNEEIEALKDRKEKDLMTV